ncbi:MAG: hypothetical protein OFPI_22690 [Osedax symbiont Rs2]|nr:MAG: hypothetical protein OFPI_22690 [Osedax symbiont Rs2]
MLSRLNLILLSQPLGQAIAENEYVVCKVTCDCLACAILLNVSCID